MQNDKWLYSSTGKKLSIRQLLARARRRCQRIRRLNASGVSQAEIAREVGISRQRVNKILKQED